MRRGAPEGTWGSGSGSANADAAELVEHYTNVFMKLKRQVAAGSPQAPPVDRPTLETCLDVAVLALSIIMAGTGNLNTLRLLRRLRRRLDSTPGGLTYGNHMAISMALGGASAFFSSCAPLAAHTPCIPVRSLSWSPHIPD
ncbi:hypothetical protein CYMTET_20929 [Cymbomonas tetramitiformis]|uniref:Uncharacterized protein n=1 Tax=Cymbomonas tetramitiformis TaxID=36881 RepID=A0AAE0G332_9CHLO|nr:hypothetical protein CYMTET_20929 [Cymbomonas tetramitiformis]